MCGPGPMFVRTLAIGPKKHDLEMCKNGEVRIYISGNSSRNMSKNKILNGKKLVDRSIIINKQRNSSFLPFLRVKLRFVPKNHNKTCFKRYFNEYHQNSGKFVDFHRVFIFPRCPGQVGRTGEISIFAVFRKIRVF